MRTEHDFLGALQIDDACYFGIHTQRARENFGDSGQRHDPVFLRAYLQVKKAAALANRELGYLDAEKAGHIIAAIDLLLAGNACDDFIVNPLAGGAGTSLNMNVNEVIANHALERAGRAKGDYGFIHPLEHVNLHQSTNDTYPTALRIAMLIYLEQLETGLVPLQQALQEKEREFSDVVRLGRTELQDALPMTAGMQFAAYAEAIGRDRWRIFKARERIKVVNLGGTAIGTGFGAPQKYIFSVIEKLRVVTGQSVTRAENMVEATQNLDSVVEVSGLLKTLAVNLLKIAEDLRLLSSGPSGGFAEIMLPAVQEGSSIMPGKVNPVILEFVSQTALLVMGHDSVIAQAAGLGNLELNQFYPLAATLMLDTMRSLELAVNRLRTKAVEGLELNRETIAAHLSDSIAVVTCLAQSIGHEAASQLYLKHRATKQSLRQLILADTLLSEQELDRLLSAENIRMMGIKK
ncbi:MAG: aspartate ammonia-lyase [Deltaproteobacteria bacterium]|nr:aspartate ammonia-lyase [Deltaproteobacteria bacterium]